MGSPATGANDRACDALAAAAKAAAANAYAPYSGFRVGAALQTTSGHVFSGCNVENASFGLTMCAERNAVFQAVMAGQREFVRLAIYTPTATPSFPCGACRQVLWEFGPNLELLLTCDGPERLLKLADLFPEPFELKRQ